MHVGRRIAGEAIGIYGKAEPFTAERLSFASKLISIPSNRENSKLEEARRIKKLYETGRTDELPYTDMELTTVVAEAVRICELENGPESFEFVLSALKIGELTLAGMPGECFTEIGRRIEKDYKGKHILVCCRDAFCGQLGCAAASTRLGRGGQKNFDLGIREDDRSDISTVHNDRLLVCKPSLRFEKEASDLRNCGNARSVH